MGFKIGPIPKIKIKPPKVKPKKPKLTDAQKAARRKKTGEMLSALGGAIGSGQTSEGDTYNPVAERGQEKVDPNPFDEQNTDDAAGR